MAIRSRAAVASIHIVLGIAVSFSTASAKDPSPTAAAKTPCPDNKPTPPLLVAALKTKRTLAVERCTPLTEGTSGWVFVTVSEDASVKDDGSAKRYEVHASVVGTDGKLMGDLTLESYSELDRGKSENASIKSVRAVDFDGDGRDEIVIESQKGRWDQTTSVQVLRIDGAKLSQVLSVPVAFTNAGKADTPTTCEGNWSIAESSGHAMLVVVAKAGAGPNSASQCEKAGTYEYALANGKFAKRTSKK